ncbi:MAG: macro domain-containing protein [Nitrospinaceae bacterium]|nr:MAG: macro domain-containing protein [Nitrospinaceae bacterium]
MATTAGRLKAHYVIHAVGPRWGEGDEVAKLEKAVTASLKRADELGLKSLAMPAISTGNFGFPLEQAANTILAVIVRYAVGPTGLRTVFLSLFDEKSVKVFSEVMDSLRPE